jgi:hypothetical protein
MVVSPLKNLQLTNHVIDNPFVNIVYGYGFIPLAFKLNLNTVAGMHAPERRYGTISNHPIFLIL